MSNKRKPRSHPVKTKPPVPRTILSGKRYLIVDNKGRPVLDPLGTTLMFKDRKKARICLQEAIPDMNSLIEVWDQNQIKGFRIQLVMVQIVDT